MPRTLRTRAFQAWWRLQRPLTLGVRGVVADRDGKILLVRHTYTPGWHFPGGGVERRETAMQALLRELKEEAGIEPSEPPKLVSVHANHAHFPNDHVLVYRIDRWTRSAPTQHGEIAEIGFFDPTRLPEGTTKATRRRLEEIFAAASASETW